jgi:hypothetical protein
MTDQQRRRYERYERWAYRSALRAVGGALDGSACIAYHTALQRWTQRYLPRLSSH